VVRGRREFVLNRKSLNAHIIQARNAGFELLFLEKEHATTGLPVSALADGFQDLDPDDLQTRGAMLILRKPQ
jgi:hypothetical protein